jgi:hypothetical protein
MSRLGAVVVVALGSLSLACSGEDPPDADTPSVTAPDGSGATDTPADEVPFDPEWGLAFELAGRAEPMTARAELQVVEGRQTVHLAITGRASGSDLVMIDLTFDNLETALGPHRVEFSLPAGGAHVAISSLDDTWYYSQGGAIDVSVDADGGIAGSFDIALAPGTFGDPREPVVLAPSDVATPLEGTFSGDWVLNCHSRLMGHATLIVGGKYCEDLAL